MIYTFIGYKVLSDTSSNLQFLQNEVQNEDK